MKSMVLIGEVATLAKDIERFSGDYANTTSALPNLPGSGGANTYQEMWKSEDEEQNGSDHSIPMANAAQAANAFMANRNASATLPNSPPATASQRGLDVNNDDEFSHSQQLKLSELLDAWEEPQSAEQKEVSF